MKGRFVHYSPSAVLHIYQRSVDKGVVFYSVEDRLVYYTVSACQARKHRVRVCAAAIMFTHTHQSVQAHSYDAVRNYLHDADTSFAKMYNNRYGREGRLFGRPVGMAQKFSSKSIRTNIIYVFNNHVEKGLCRRAVDERWSFLPYILSNHPFSEEISRKEIGTFLRKALALVDRRVRKLQNLSYYDVDRILPRLDERERQQFIDYVIWKYSLIDFSFAVSLFGSRDNLIMAIDSTTGGEYDICEEHSGLSDVKYLELIDFADSGGFLLKIYSAPLSVRTDLAIEANRRIGVPLNQLKKFYHI